ncbi:MAG: hypothetical protein JXP34_08510, partial [Planctomycetes bacterium]|nr:hypothetical protein [Planctomycetota bacterium]
MAKSPFLPAFLCLVVSTALCLGGDAAALKGIQVDLDGDGQFTGGDMTALLLWVEQGGDLDYALAHAVPVGPGLLDLSAFFASDTADIPGPSAPKVKASDLGSTLSSTEGLLLAATTWTVGDPALGRDFSTIKAALTNQALAPGDIIEIYDDP